MKVVQVANLRSASAQINPKSLLLSFYPLLQFFGRK